jgi:hypothetical protein
MLKLSLFLQVLGASYTREIIRLASFYDGLSIET